MPNQTKQTSSTDELTVELEELRQQLRSEENEWAKWREAHVPRGSESQSGGLQELRDRIFFLEAKLSRAKR